MCLRVGRCGFGGLCVCVAWRERKLETKHCARASPPPLLAAARRFRRRCRLPPQPRDTNPLPPPAPLFLWSQKPPSQLDNTKTSTPLKPPHGHRTASARERRGTVSLLRGDSSSLLHPRPPLSLSPHVRNRSPPPRGRASRGTVATPRPPRDRRAAQPPPPRAFATGATRLRRRQRRRAPPLRASPPAASPRNPGHHRRRAAHHLPLLPTLLRRQARRRRRRRACRIRSRHDARGARVYRRRVRQAP